MVCRNECMNHGGSYPRSCPTCKFSGVCSQGVERDPFSAIGPEYYIPVKEEVPMNNEYYGIVYEDTYSSAGYDPGDPSYTTKYLAFKEFSTEEQLKTWLLQNNEKYSKVKVTKILKFTELKAKTEVTISLG